jgi:hypothetical protein
VTPETLASIGAVMSNPWWAAVALLVFMFFHFAWIARRDKSIEKRFAAMFEAIIAMEHTRADADIVAAKALTGLESEVGHLSRQCASMSDIITKCQGPLDKGACDVG